MALHLSLEANQVTFKSGSLLGDANRLCSAHPREASPNAREASERRLCPSRQGARDVVLGEVRKRH